MRWANLVTANLGPAAEKRLESAYRDEVPMADLERRFRIPARRIVQILEARGVPLRPHGARAKIL